MSKYPLEVSKGQISLLAWQTDADGHIRNMMIEGTARDMIDYIVKILPHCYIKRNINQANIFNKRLFVNLGL